MPDSLETLHVAVSASGAGLLKQALKVAGRREERVVGFPADDYYWRDLGRRESLEQAARDLREKVVLQ